MKKRIKSDVLIIGSSLAGTSAALALAQSGLKILIVSRENNPSESNTEKAQGGIITIGPDDSPALLFQDIMRAGAGLCHPKAVEILVDQGPKIVKEILVKEIKVPFSKAGGKIHYTLEAAHSKPRILHVGDTTGRAIEEKIIKKLKSFSNIKFLTNHTAIDLLTIPHHSKNPLAVYDDIICLGAYILNRKTNQIQTVFSRKTVLATGGAGQVFLHTTNFPGARGDGLAMAHRAGAQIINLEYIQFHPTTFYHRDAKRFLISETVRGEGGKLETRDGKMFMYKYDKREDLAPRDVVARAIYSEMISRKEDYVLLNLASYLSATKIKKRFPNIYKTCLSFGFDITKKPIPVVPAAHYFCGGIKVDEWGQSNIKNLYAVGEVSCTGIHGANRLAANALLECLTWGWRSGEHIIQNIEDGWSFKFSEIYDWHDRGLTEEIDPALISQDWLTIKNTMWNYVSLIRTQKRLERAKADLEYLKHRIDNFYQETKLTDDLIGLRNTLQVALMIIYAGLANRQSRGCHWRAS